MLYCKTKQMKEAFNRFCKSDLYTLRDCYDRYSQAKESAYNYCRRLFQEYSGDAFGIISYNSMCFSVGFTGEINGKKAFFYITRDYDRYIYMEDLEK